MRKNFALAILIAPFIILSLFTTTSCKKTVTHIITDTVINTVTDTLIKTVTDTLLVPAKDTVFAMDTSAWNLYSYATGTLVNAGATTYVNTSEGIKFFGQTYRYGSRLEIKSPVAFEKKVIYFKWKAYSANVANDVEPSIKYDPVSNDGIPPIQGVDLSLFSINFSSSNYFEVNDNTWYYTRADFTAGGDYAHMTTSTINYSNLGGSVVLDKSVNVYTKKGYIAIRIGDTFAANSAYCILGECKIASN